MTAVLAARKLTAGYGKLAAIRDVDVEVAPGEVVALLGPNGAGKTTLLLTLCGRLRPLSGDVAWNGATAWKPVHRRVRDGLAVVLDNRSIVSGLSVRDNLRAAKSDVRAACEHFPALTALLGRRAGLLSGGEQQMLTVGRALSRRPDVLLIDELSQGLAPKIADTVAAAVRAASDRGMACVLVEQNLTRALAASDRFVLMNHGRIVLAGASADFRDDTARIERHFFATRTDRHPSPDPIAAAT